MRSMDHSGLGVALCLVADRPQAEVRRQMAQTVPTTKRKTATRLAEKTTMTTTRLAVDRPQVGDLSFPRQGGLDQFLPIQKQRIHQETPHLQETTLEDVAEEALPRCSFLGQRFRCRRQPRRLFLLSLLYQTSSLARTATWMWSPSEATTAAWFHRTRATTGVTTAVQQT